MPNDLEFVLTRFNNLESEAEKEEYIEILENLLESYNKAAAAGEPLVPDSIYDACMDILREFKPDSDLLHRVWSEDDPSVPFDANIDRYLVSNPMMSIQTIKHLADKPVSDFKSKMPVVPIEAIASVKENGHGIRVMWDNGHLAKATSRGRSTNGKDLTNQVKLILGEFEPLYERLGQVEMRGEALLPFENLEKAREFNPTIKSAFSGVASMIRASASPEETKLLDIVFYDILCDQLEFETLSEKFSYISDCGFKVPEYFTKEISRKNLEADLNDIVQEMDIRTTNYEYYTDGVVVAVNENELFNAFGSEDKFRLGNLALKIGRWKQDGYSGVVKEIAWVNGKSKKTPVAILEEGVITAAGNTVTNVPLYAPLYVLMLEAYQGNTIYFKYGGEAGVVPTTHDGRLVTDKGLR